MSYKKQNFRDGDVLHASALSNMENAIIQNEADIASKQPKGDYATADELNRSIEMLVSYDQQNMTDAQKNQARTNIGAVSAAYVVEKLEELREELMALIQNGDFSAAIAILDNAILDMATLA